MSTRRTLRASRARLPLLLVLASAVGASGDSLAARVAFYNVHPWDGPTVVYRGWRDGACADPLVASGSPTVSIGDAQTRGECPPELDVFTRFHGAFATTSPVWEPVGGGATEYRIALPPINRLHVSVWVVRWSDPTLESRVQWAVFHALAAYLRFRTGQWIDVKVNYVNSGSPQAGYIGTGCHDALRARTTWAPGDNPYVENALNVFVVQTILDPDGSATTWMGLTCSYIDAANVAYLSSTFNNATLAHEIGHMLGMMAPEDEWGHTNWLDCGGVSCFSTENLMYSDVVAVNELTLGQAYRMNFDARSWLNRAAVAPARQLIRACQSDWLWNWPCPPLTLN